MTRVQSSTQPKFATDNDPSTLFTLNTAPSSDGPQAGVTIDLGSAQKATRIKIETPTPGFGGLVYGAVGPDIPKTLTDPGWKHLRNFSDAGSADGTATITLGKHGAGVDSYRYLMLWFTNPPPSEPGARDVPPSTDPAASTTAAPTTPPATTPPPTSLPTSTQTTPPALGATVSIAELSVFN
jgi:hypothetical protein